MELIKVLILLIVLGILYQLCNRSGVEGFDEEVLPPRAYLDGVRLASKGC